MEGRSGCPGFRFSHGNHPEHDWLQTSLQCLSCRQEDGTLRHSGAVGRATEKVSVAGAVQNHQGKQCALLNASSPGYPIQGIHRGRKSPGNVIPRTHSKMEKAPNDLWHRIIARMKAGGFWKISQLPPNKYSCSCIRENQS